MADHAQHMADIVLRLENQTLAFDVASLATVDGLLGKFHDAGDDPNRMAETIFQIGAYIGEVIVRTAGGQWIALGEHDEQNTVGWPVVTLVDGSWVNPVMKAFKRVENGPADSITYFYDALVRTPRKPRRRSTPLRPNRD